VRSRWQSAKSLPAIAAPHPPFVEVLARTAQLQTGLDSRRTRVGWAAARLRGQLRARPPKLNHRQEHHIVGLYWTGRSRSVSCSPSPATVSRALRRADLTADSDAAHNAGPTTPALQAQVVLFDGFDPLDVIGPYEVLHAGGHLGGSARSAAETVPLQDVVLDGDHLTWSQAITRPMRLRLAFDVTVAVADDGTVPRRPPAALRSQRGAREAQAGPACARCS